jgi:hypothetical protein
MTQRTIMLKVRFFLQLRNEKNVTIASLEQNSEHSDYLMLSSHCILCHVQVHLTVHQTVQLACMHMGNAVPDMILCHVNRHTLRWGVDV